MLTNALIIGMNGSVLQKYMLEKQFKKSPNQTQNKIKSKKKQIE